MTYPTLIHERVASARAGENPTVIARMPSGWAVLGDQQFFRGYCLLLADPVVTRLTDLDEPDRLAFLGDMAALGEAVLDVTEAARINYEILGNGEPALHAHVFPRFAHEPSGYRRSPVWLYPPELRNQDPFSVEEHGTLLAALAERLT